VLPLLPLPTEPLVVAVLLLSEELVPVPGVVDETSAEPVAPLAEASVAEIPVPEVPVASVDEEAVVLFISVVEVVLAVPCVDRVELHESATASGNTKKSFFI